MNVPIYSIPLCELYELLRHIGHDHAKHHDTCTTNCVLFRSLPIVNTFKINSL